MDNAIKSKLESRYRSHFSFHKIDKQKQERLFKMLETHFKNRTENELEKIFLDLLNLLK